MTLVPVIEDAIAFLDLIYPSHPRLLVAINPLAEKGKEETAGRTLEPGDNAGIEKFMRTAFGRGWNVYYTVNQTRPYWTNAKGERIDSFNKKCSRADLSEIHYFQVDVDPRKPDADEREDMPAFLARERGRILTLLENPPIGTPAPTAIVHSGGGYNGLWKIEQPITVLGVDDKERVKHTDELKHYNRHFERVFGGDHCHNMDRVLRLPGSVNFPNHVKIRAGRTEPTLARLISWHADRVYPLSAFTKAPVKREQTSGPAPKMKVPSGGVQRIRDLEELDLSKIPRTAELLRRVIQDGRDSTDPTRFTDDNGKFDRSRAVYFVMCQLAKAGIDRDQRYAILTDPRFGISESIIEKGSSMERHALRSVERGEEAAECDELAELNDRHCVVMINGLCRVVQEEEDPSGKVGRNRLTISDWPDIKKCYSNRLVHCGTKYNPRSKKEEDVFRPLGDWWLDHPQRRQLKGVVFAPGRETPGYYNLWQGFAVEALEGNCQLFLDHMLNIVCGGNEVYYEYLLNWMAYAVQHPDEPAEVAVVFRGEPGVGKGVVAREFGKLFGRHFLQITNSNHLVGQFNDHLRDCVLLFLDEAFFAGDVKHKSIMKNLITEPEIMIEKKGYDAKLSANHLHVMMASNENWVVPADSKERRYFVLDVLNTKRGVRHKEYWKALYGSMDNGGREALLFMLQQRNLDGFNPREFPETKALAEQKMLSLTPMQEWWYGKLQAGVLFPTHAAWTAPVIVERLQNDYMLYAGKLKGRVSGGTELGRFLNKMVKGMRVARKVVEESTDHGVIKARHRVYEFPSLEKCRESWDAEFGFTADWSPIEDHDELPEGGF